MERISREYHTRVSSASDWMEVQDEHGQSSVAMRYFEDHRSGPDGVYRQKFNTMVDDARAELSDGTLAELEYVLPIIEWRMFGGTRSALPDGLAYEYCANLPNGWSINFVDDSVRWMHDAAIEQLDSRGLRLLQLEVYYAMRDGEGFDAALSDLARTSSLYRLFEGFTEAQQIKDQPLQGYWREVHEVAVREQVARTWGVPVPGIERDRNANNELTRRVAALDLLTSPAKIDSEAASDIAYGRVMDLLTNTLLRKRMAYHEPVSGLSYDDQDILVEYADGYKDKVYSLLLMHDMPVRNIITGRRQSDAETHAFAMICKAIDWSHGIEVPTFSQALEEWASASAESLEFDFKDDLMDELVINADGTIPDGIVRTYIYKDSTPDEEPAVAVSPLPTTKRKGLMGIIQKDEVQPQQTSVDDLEPEAFGYRSQGDMSLHTMAHGVADFAMLNPSEIPRMYLPSTFMDVSFSDAQNSDLRIKSRYNGMHVPGYVAMGIDGEDFTVFRPHGHDPYSEIPRNIGNIGWLSLRKLARMHHEMGLHEIADTLSSQRKMHLSDLAALLKGHAEYVDDLDEARAARMSELLRRQRYSELLNSQGKLELQCTAAGQLLRDSVQFVGFEATVKSGYTIKQGATGPAGHAQVQVMIKGLPYMLDSTPSLTAQNVRQQESINLTNGLAPLTKRVERLTTQETIKKHTHALYAQLQSLYNVPDKEALFDAINAVPASQRGSDVTWRTVSLITRIEFGDEITPNQLREELAYIKAVQGADEETLAAMGMYIPSGRQLAILKDSLKTMISILSDSK